MDSLGRPPSPLRIRAGMASHIEFPEMPRCRVRKYIVVCELCWSQFLLCWRVSSGFSPHGLGAASVYEQNHHRLQFDRVLLSYFLLGVPRQIDPVSSSREVVFSKVKTTKQTKSNNSSLRLGFPRKTKLLFTFNARRDDPSTELVTSCLSYSFLLLVSFTVTSNNHVIPTSLHRDSRRVHPSPRFRER